MDLVSSTACFLPQLEMEYDWQIEMMKPFEYPHSASINPLQDLRATKQPKRELSPSSSSSFLAYESGNRVISFGAIKSELEPVSDLVDFVGAFEPTKPGTKRVAGGFGGGGDFSNIDHVAAERKRREKLTERFVHLSSLLPDLKKLDKASVLAEAARYLKQLQEQVKTLQEQAPKPPMESNSSSSSTHDIVISSSDHQMPRIEVKFSEKDVLVKVHCERKQGLVSKVLDEMKKLHLSIINLNAMPFGKSAMDITVIAQMSDEFSTTANDLESLLQRSMKLFCDNS